MDIHKIYFWAAVAAQDMPQSVIDQLENPGWSLTINQSIDDYIINFNYDLNVVMDEVDKWIPNKNVYFVKFSLDAVEYKDLMHCLLGMIEDGSTSFELEVQVWQWFQKRKEG